MKDNKRNIDDFFQEELGNYTEIPPALVWENLEKRLDDNKSKRTKKIWWLYFLLPTIFIGGSIAAFYNFKNENPSQQITALNQTKKEFTNTILNEVEPIDKSTGENIVASEPSTEISNTKNNSHNIEAKETQKEYTKRHSNENIKNHQANNNQAAPNSSSKKQNIAIEDNRNENTDNKISPNIAAKKTKDKVKSNSSVVENTNSSLSKNTKVLSNGNSKALVEPQKPTQEKRGLSAVPIEDEKEIYDEPKNISKEDEEDEDEKASNKLAMNNNKTNTSKSVQQINAISKARENNPLAAAPVAEDKIDETIDEKGDKIQESSSNGAGGGGSASTAKKDKSKKSLNMAIGVKAGYERGVQNFTSSKFTGSIFAEIALSKKINFIVQPTIKIGKTNKDLSSENVNSYVQAGDITSNRFYQYLDTAGKATGYFDYAQQQRYDSFSNNARFIQKFTEIEVPFLFRIKVDSKLSVLAGMNFVFGKTIGYEITANNVSNGFINDTTRKYFGELAPTSSSIFLTPGTSNNSITNYSAPINLVRFGYSLGLSYAASEKIMIDLLVQQNVSGLSGISNVEAKKILQQPYVRLSLGYTLFGSSKK